MITYLSNYISVFKSLPMMTQILTTINAFPHYMKACADVCVCVCVCVCGARASKFRYIFTRTKSGKFQKTVLNILVILD